MIMMIRLGVSALIIPSIALVGNLWVEAAAGPNFIVMQPDDFEFFEEWTPPAHIYRRAGRNEFTLSSITGGLPNIERLRTEGVQMMQAYTASAMCGTSRYSTMTGRYPSRSAYGREINFGLDPGNIVIPTTKLEDNAAVVDGNDCSSDNLAALMQRNGYRTGMVGKWHLANVNSRDTYSDIQTLVRNCGFDYADGIYAENLGGNWHDGTFTHNMEHLAERAIDFITSSSTEPFFLYFNPTAPHSSGNVLEALTLYGCTDTPGGTLSTEPRVVTMTEGSTCDAYRQTVIDRANGDTSNAILGSIWVDDAIGALLATLESTGQLDNTFFLFQMDHGQEGKGTLWEQGIRLAQFIRFPNQISAGTTFNGLASTIDIAPTIIDFAGITSDYSMDGQSWRSAVTNTDTDQVTYFETERCLFFELDYDRAIRCGCYKYLVLNDIATSDTATTGSRYGLITSSNAALFDLCLGTGDVTQYVTSGGDAPERTLATSSDVTTMMETLHTCHANKIISDTDAPDYTECGPVYTLASSRHVRG